MTPELKRLIQAARDRVAYDHPGELFQALAAFDAAEAKPDAALALLGEALPYLREAACTSYLMGLCGKIELLLEESDA